MLHILLYVIDINLISIERKYDYVVNELL